MSTSLDDLLADLGGIAPERVRLFPPPGTATEQDLLDLYERERRRYELVNGVLVEKAMTFFEARLAQMLGYFLVGGESNHGLTVGTGCFFRLRNGIVRAPDVSFIRWERVPYRRIPREPIPALVPNLVGEVLSTGNTRPELERKLREYFLAGVELVWYIDPPTRSAQIWTSLDDTVEIEEEGTLDGGTVLPGFRLALQDLFARAARGLQP